MIKTLNFKWVVNPRRKNKRTGARQPVWPSDYFKELCKEGAGWNVGGQTNK